MSIYHQACDPESKTISYWKPVAALLDWSFRPEFWNEQDFNLVDYPPLKRLLLQAAIRAQVRSLADKETPAVRKSLEALGAQPVLTEADLRAAARQVGEASTTANGLRALAAKVGQEHKWLAPRVLETTQIQLESRVLTFPAVGRRDPGQEGAGSHRGDCFETDADEEKATES